MRKARRIALRCALVLAGLVAAIVVAEVVVRATDPLGTSYYRDVNRYVGHAITLVGAPVTRSSRIFEAKANVDLELATFRFRTDERGLRTGTAPPEPAAAPGERMRILFLGDSVTLGWGVDDEDTWVRRLERDARAAPDAPLECLNAGHILYNTVQQADWLAAHGEELDPDLVVLTFVVNDIDDHYGLYQELTGAVERRAEQAPAPAAHGWIARARPWVPALSEVALYLVRRNASLSVPRQDPATIESTPEYVEGWARVEPGLERILALCDELEAPLVVLDSAVPWIPGLRRWCEANGVPWYPFAFTPDERERDIENSLADPHANALGNELLYAKAHAALADAGYLAPRAD